MKKMVVGLTGASGSIYAKRLVEELISKGYFVHLITTTMGEKVFEYELECSLKAWVQSLNQFHQHLKVEHNDNLFSNVASGSYRFDAMIVLPCSMGTLAKMSAGISDTLLIRCADVCLKEKRRLIIVPRETPYNSIHLENMLKLSNLGVTILPATPGFYHRPTSFDQVVDFVIGKILDHLDIQNNLFDKWQEPKKEY
ncbi:MAG TPA: aromatic acid decarboxylase [Firmicutes bacterium]|nr:aromatic acid decarboxylase [Bacillota bacterium]